MNYKSIKNKNTKESQLKGVNYSKIEFKNIDRDMDQPTESDIAEIDLYAKKMCIVMSIVNLILLLIILLT